MRIQIAVLFHRPATPVHFPHGPFSQRLAQKVPAAPWHVLVTLWSICDALHDGLTAYRRYARLRSRVTAHDTALRDALAARS